MFHELFYSFILLPVSFIFLPAFNKLATRPFIFTCPVVGVAVRLSIFKSVDFPAPLRPMMPGTSPCFTSKLISRNAHTYSLIPFLERSFSSPIFKYGSSLPRTLYHQRLRSWLRVPRPTLPRQYYLEMFFYFYNGTHLFITRILGH